MLLHECLPEELRPARPGGAGAGVTDRLGPLHLPTMREQDLQVQALQLQAKAGNAAVTSLLAGLGSLRGPRPLPQVQRCGPAAPDCGCGPDEKEAASVAAPAQEQEESPGDHDAAHGGGVCLTCEALRAAKGSPGGAIAYVDTAKQPQWRPPQPAQPSVRTAPVTGDEDDTGAAASGLASELVSEAGSGTSGPAADQATEEAPGSPAERGGGAAGRPENLRHDPAGESPPPVMVPVSATAGASVVCKGHNTYEVWQNASEPDCVQPCEKKHEEKHIADFNADPNYKATVKCASLPDGETFTYASHADAARFECAASDVEIACLSAQIAKETDEDCKAMATRRRDVILPNYKKGFGC